MNGTDILYFGQRTFRNALERVPQSSWERPGVCGIWSVKNIVAHLASYEVALAELLESFPGEPQGETVERMIRDPGGFNDGEVEMRASVEPAATVAELEAAYERVYAAIVRLDPALMRQPGTLPWYGSEYALDDYLVYAFYGHKREHAAQVNAFADTLAEPAHSTHQST